MRNYVRHFREAKRSQASILKSALSAALIGILFFTATLISPATTTAAGWWKPTAETPIHWQWQIGATFNTATDIIPNVTVYDIDLFDTSATTVKYLHSLGCKVIAYIDVGGWESNRPDADKFPSSVIGDTMSGWNEKWLDIRSNTVKQIMGARIDLAASKGFDGVEPDCDDGYTNDTGFPLTAQDQLTYNKWIADRCHQKGLSVGLKNDVEQAKELEPYFDWTLNEEAFQYDEYQQLSVFTKANKAVFQVEYGRSTPQAKAMNSLHFNSMTRDLNLVSPGSSGYVRIPCTPDNQNTWTGSSGGSQPTTPPVITPPVGGGEGGSSGGGGIGGGASDSSLFITSSGITISDLSFTSDDSKAQFNIAIGTTVTPASATFPLTINILPEEERPAANDIKFVGSAYQVGSENINVTPQANLIFTYDNISANDTSLIGVLKIGKYDAAAAEWKILDNSTFVPEKNAVIAITNSSGIYSLVADLPVFQMAGVNLRKIQVEPAKPTAGQEITATVSLVNTNMIGGNYPIKVLLDDVIVHSDEITIETREYKTLSYPLGSPSVGNHTLTINENKLDFVVGEKPQVAIINNIPLTPPDIHKKPGTSPLSWTIVLVLVIGIYVILDIMLCLRGEGN